ncbi:ParB/RepB/Spo0J family partition protein [Streptomyces parvus]|uniref:ParB N-terminal domain-containing protein n=1 Tax=Streptomyces parvus TaxID=66428 RepID=A0A7K3RV69_9ACTN|nr:ParB N-terminal domain-containing protein [Streptomyces parvus]NEC19135.1 ParB N-terminal domain-containing protein [Streptomyces parvus]
MPVSSFLPGDSPRLLGPDKRHVEALAQIDGALPPILVHWPSMKIIDGHHRLLAAQIRGDEEIEVSFFDGDAEAAFVIAVEANRAHGLPLTRADRTAAASRILKAHPNWSDRAIAAASGLSAVTVSGIRQKESAGSPLGARIGRDGKARPLSAAEGRRLAGDLIAEQPAASLREIAKIAGIAPATVRDVRERMRRGQDPVPPKQRAAESLPEQRGTESPPQRRKEKTVPRRCVSKMAQSGQRRGVVLSRLSSSDADTDTRPTDIMERLLRDPSLRFNESRRSLLRWLGSQATGSQQWNEFLEQVPPHAVDAVAEFARACAQDWNSFAEELESRSD